MEKLYKRNKEKPSADAAVTLLEILVANQLSKPRLASAAPAGSSTTAPPPQVPEARVEEPAPEDAADDFDFILQQREKQRQVAATQAQAKANRMFGGAAGGGWVDTEQGSSGAPSSQGKPAGFAPATRAASGPSTSSAAAGPPLYTGSMPLQDNVDIEAVKQMKQLIFGNPRGEFNDAWSQQGFFFVNDADMQYGLKQSQGGSCGVLAVVQAFIIKDLLFESRGASLSNLLNPSPDARTNALEGALAAVLWQAATAGGVKDPVAIVCSGSIRRADGLVQFACTSQPMLRAVVHQELKKFTTPNGAGVVLLLYSCILSRGMSRLKDDMDFAESTLMGAHGYCGSEMVNLALIGRAVSNYHDGEIVLGDDTGSSADRTVLKGIPQPCGIGFLSRFERYNNFQVGAHCKCPQLPLWVINSESHYSVLFHADGLLNPSVMPNLPDGPTGPTVDLHYYDQLAGMDEPIKLTVSLPPAPQAIAPPADLDALNPPLEDCLQTRWPGSPTDWNGVEPLL